MPATRFVLPLHRIDQDDLELVGQRAVTLATLNREGLNVPDGFVITTQAFLEVMRPHGRSDGSLDWRVQPNFSADFLQEVVEAYEKLGNNASVAVRVSPVFSDSIRLGNQLDPDEFLGVQGENNLLEVVRKVWTVFQEAADHMMRFSAKTPPGTPACALLIHRMVPAETSGVAFSFHPVTQNKSQAVIEAVWGLDEELDGKMIKPHRVVVDRTSGEILEITEVLQKEQLRLQRGRSAVTKVADLNLQAQPISQAVAEKILASLKRAQQVLFYPQELEWAWDRERVWVIESRNLEVAELTSVVNNQNNTARSTAPFVSPTDVSYPPVSQSGSILISAQPAAPGLVTGPVRIVQSVQDAEKLKTGEIMVCSMTSAALFSAMKKAAAVITEQGGLGSHAAVVCRPLGLPSVMFAYNARATLKSGEIVTVNGLTGQILRGGVGSYNDSLTDRITNSGGSASGGSSAPSRSVSVSNLHASSPRAPESVQTQRMVVEQDLLTVKHPHPARIRYGRWSLDRALMKLGMHYRELDRRDGVRVLVNKVLEELEAKVSTLSSESLLFELSSLSSSDLRELTYGRELEPVEPNPKLGYWGAVRHLADRTLLSVEQQVYQAVRSRFRSVEHGVICSGIKTVQGAVSMPRLLERENIRGSFWIRPASIGILHQADRFSSYGYHGLWMDLDELLAAYVGMDLTQIETTLPADYYEPGFIEHVRAAIHAQRSTRIKIVLASRFEIPDHALKEHSDKVVKVRTERD